MVLHNLVIGIKTYNRLNYLKKLINSFIRTCNTNYKWYIIIADDGSTDGTLTYLDKLFMQIKKVNNTLDLIIIKNKRVNVARQTNSILEVCNYLNFDFGFIVDDDIFFKKKGWDNDYISAYLKYGYDHLVYFNTKDRLPYKSIKKDNTLLALIDAQHCMGCLWTITPKVLDIVGYFDEQIFKGAGHEHQEYTIRCCRAGFNDLMNLYDVIDSRSKIELFCRSTDRNYVTLTYNPNLHMNLRERDRVLKSNIIKKKHTELAKNITIYGNKEIFTGSNILLC